MPTKSTALNMQTRYQNAQQIMQCLWTKKGPANTGIFPTWVGETDCFWYIRDTGKGQEFRLVDAGNASNSVAFDHQKLASALAKVSGKQVNPDNLPLSNIELEVDPLWVTFTAFDKRWQYDVAPQTCDEITMPYGSGEVVSPDGKYLVFGKDYNLWLRNLKSGAETPLTTDGEEYYVYGAAGTAWGMPLDCSLQVSWSPDSKRVFTVQKDTRQVEALPLVHHVPQDGSIRPKTTYSKFAYPGEEHIETLRLLTIDIATGKQQPVDYPQIPVTRNSWGFFTSSLGWWHKDSQRAYFVDVDRYYKYVRLVELDTNSGATRPLVEETTDTQINLMNNGDMIPSFVPLPETNELLWFSERSGWGHLYLYDLNTGKLKNTVTQGDWLLRDVVTVLEKSREVIIQTAGRVQERNPYYRDVVRVNMDTGELLTLASDETDHFAYAMSDFQGIALNGFRNRENKRGTSPTGNYTVVTRSRVDILPESVLVDHEGKEVMLLETASLKDMPAGWQLPEPVQAKAADGKTDIYGVIFRPSDFSPDKSYPVISDIFNTPDMPWASIGAFENNVFDGLGFFNGAALAELGFIVVQLDGRGGSYRSKAFKDSGYGNLQLPTMQADQVAGLKQLAKRYPYMDVGNMGLSGHLGGGPGIVQGLLDYPNRFKVGVTSFVHDSRLMPATMWGDMYEGKSRLEQHFPEEKLENLQGKLLFLVGMLDTTNPPASTFRMVEALHKANKDFDMVMLPNHDHGYDPYLIRRAWDYYVEHLLGEKPPKEYALDGLFSLVYGE